MQNFVSLWTEKKVWVSLCVYVHDHTKLGVVLKKIILERTLIPLIPTFEVLPDTSFSRILEETYMFKSQKLHRKISLYVYENLPNELYDKSTHA